MACDREKRRLAILEEMAKMREELSGCDWCCGDGDRHWDELEEELQQLADTLANQPAPENPNPPPLTTNN